MALFTFGYEGLAIDGFIARLKKAGVAVVVDVRELPLSRKKGFSKTAFAEALHGAGIAYTHVPTFGCPKSIRNRVQNRRQLEAIREGLPAPISTPRPQRLPAWQSFPRRRKPASSASRRISISAIVAWWRGCCADAGGATV